MGLETGTFLSDLVPSNPSGADFRSTADDHIRLIKALLRNSFPNIDAAMNATPTELNLLVGLTAAAAELNILDGAVVTTAQLTKLGTLTEDEIGLLDGLLASTAELNILDGATLTVDELNTLTGILATVDELNYLQGVTSNVQDQLDTKTQGVFVDNADGSPSVSANIFDLTALNAVTWESFGPTGSGANNIWPALDTLPSTTKWLRITLSGFKVGISSTSSVKRFSARKNGSAVTDEAATVVVYMSSTPGNVNEQYLTVTSEFTVPVSSVKFDLYTFGGLGSVNQSGAGFYLRLVGYGE